MASEDLTPWLLKIKSATSRSSVFAILDEFRKLDWTDQQRSAMAKVYMRRIERLVDTDTGTEADTQAAVAASDDNGPVWYEKM